MSDPRPLYERSLPDGRHVSVWPLLFGKFRLHVAPSADSMFFDDGWDYDGPTAAVAAAEVWDGAGEPDGWFRNPRTGRRRPDGDASQEYVAW